MIEFSRALTELLEARPGLRVLVVRPALRNSPSHYKSDLVHLQVGVSGFRGGDSILVYAFSSSPSLPAWTIIYVCL